MTYMIYGVSNTTREESLLFVLVGSWLHDNSSCSMLKTNSFQSKTLLSTSQSCSIRERKIFIKSIFFYLQEHEVKYLLSMNKKKWLLHRWLGHAIGGKSPNLES